MSFAKNTFAHGEAAGITSAGNFEFVTGKTESVAADCFAQMLIQQTVRLRAFDVFLVTVTFLSREDEFEFSHARLERGRIYKLNLEILSSYALGQV